LPTGISGDPHIVFAHGGRADFRGEDKANYVFLSAPNISFAVQTEFVDFLLPRPQLVHGSFITKAGIVIRSEVDDREFCALYDAKVPGFRVHDFKTHDVHVYDKWETDEIDTHAVLFLKDLTLVTRAYGWEINVTRRKIFNALPENPEWRLNVAIQTLDESALSTSYGTTHMSYIAPHGIIGQSFDGDDVAVSGATDDYLNAGREMTTTAQAEGAIEGSVSQYRIPNLCFHKFYHSRFYTTEHTSYRDISTLDGQHTTSTRSKMAYTADE
jgi:hypothetical protein